jgi:hypothetical protein
MWLSVMSFSQRFLSQSFNDQESSFLNSLSDSFRPSELPQNFLVAIYILLGLALIWLIYYLFFSKALWDHGRLGYFKRWLRNQPITANPRLVVQKIEITIERDDKPMVTGQILNLSVTGVFIKMLGPLSVGEKFHFYFRLGKEINIDGTAEVMRSQFEGDKSHEIGIGCRFLHFSANDQVRLAKYLREINA